MGKTLYREIYANIETILNQKGMTKTEFAQRASKHCKTDQRTIYNRFYGKSAPQIEFVKLAAKTLEVSADYILGLTNEPEIKKNSVVNTHYDEVSKRLVIFLDNGVDINDISISRLDGLSMNNKDTRFMKFVELHSSRSGNENNVMIKFTCSKEIKISSPYAWDNNARQQYRYKTIENSYVVVGGNIFQDDFDSPLDTRFCGNDDIISMYDYIENFSEFDYEQMKKRATRFTWLYNKQSRHYGVIGELSSRAFILLWYAMGYYSKQLSGL